MAVPKQQSGGHVGVPTKSFWCWTFFLSKNFLFFQYICTAADHVSKNAVHIWHSLQTSPEKWLSFSSNSHRVPSCRACYEVDWGWATKITSHCWEHEWNFKSQASSYTAKVLGDIWVDEAKLITHRFWETSLDSLEKNRITHRFWETSLDSLEKNRLDKMATRSATKTWLV